MMGTRLGTVLILVGAIVAAGCFGGTTTGVAGPGTQCRIGADCGGGRRCVSGVCVAAVPVKAGEACIATRDCDAALYCDARALCAAGGSGAAGQACTTDAACAPPLRCALGAFLGVCAPSGSGERGATCQVATDCLSGLWCGRDQSCQALGTAYPPFGGVACADEGAFRPYFEIPRPGRPPADFFRLPFPNDVRVHAGQIDLADFPRPGPSVIGVDLVDLYVATWTAEFDGFSAIAPVTFRFSAAIDPTTATGDSVHYLDLTPGATLGSELARSWSFTSARNKYVCQNRLAVQVSTASPLLPGHTYAAILTTAIKSTKGDAAVADSDLVALLAAKPTADSALADAWVAYQPLRDWLASKGTGAPSVAAAAVFTVQDAPGHMQRLADAVALQPAPVLSALTLCNTGVTSPCDDGTPARACVAASPRFHEIHGKLTVPIFQRGTPPYDKPDQGSGGIPLIGGVPQLVRTEEVCFALSIPKGVAAPGAGWPLVVYHHGTGGSMRSIVTDGIADALATGAAPAAVLGFDAVEHGARRGASTASPDQLVFNLLNPRAARDNYLQGAVDVLSALRVARVAVDAAASPVGAAISFNAGALAFFGHEQGSTSGQLALPFADAAPAAVLSGAGAFVSASLLDRRSPADLSAGLALAAGEPLDGVHPVLTLLQSFFDRSDPLNTNPLMVTRPAAARASKHVFMSWGVGDTYTPRSAREAGAFSMHLPAIRPLVETEELLLVSRPVTLDVTGGDGKMRTALVSQYLPTGATTYDGSFVALREPTAIADWSAFLKSYFATGTPAVP